MTEILVRVEADSFVAGLVVDEKTQRVIRTAPILKTWRDLPYSTVRRIILQNRWSMQIIRPEATP